MEILLNKILSKKNKNVNNVLTTQLIGGKKLLPQSSFFTKINENDVYNDERKNCNLIRLNCTINPICSNILFNSITEIIKNEGAPSAVKLLNYGGDGYIEREDFDDKIYCKNADTYLYGSVLEGVRDTQISNKQCNFHYHCGIDMFNNHILRNNTFKTICYNELKERTFNTLFDTMRDENGNLIKHRVGRVTQHLYTTEDIDTYEKSIENNLIEKNGWFGFINVGKFAVIDNNNEVMDIFRVINYRRSCDFIQMYPSSDLWSFTPKYNSYLHRLEKNWNYCLTYPSSSTTHNITFIREKTNSLKIMYIDDRVKLKNGIHAYKVYCISKHGLKKGEYINLYKGDNIFLSCCEIREIENDYVFYVFNNGAKLTPYVYELQKSDIDTKGVDTFQFRVPFALTNCIFTYNEEEIVNNTFITNKQINKSDIKVSVGTVEFHGETITYSENDVVFQFIETQIDKKQYKYQIKDVIAYPLVTYVISNDRKKVYCGNGDDRATYYLIDNKYVNLDDNCQDFSFKKLVDNEEVEYYVRIFSRLPNWKGCNVKIDKNQLYGTDKDLIAQYQTLDHDFENHISHLSFAKNIYGDDLSQIVYTDDIDISYLRDNLGRPLTSIYLTLLKNNKGYKEWYGKNGIPIEIRKKITEIDEEYHIEYSHCFGMLNCAFRLSKESLPHIGHNNSMQLNNIDSSFQYQGLDVEDLQHSNIIYEKILKDKNLVDQDKDDYETLNRSYRSRFKEILNDEIQYGVYKNDETNEIYLGDTHFYGDLCAYSTIHLIEEPIQQIEMRFNTAQRELCSLDTSYEYFKKLQYDEIISDDLDKNGFMGKTYDVLNAHQHKEGYCYYPHYEIPIKTFSKTLFNQHSIHLTLMKIESVSNEEERAIRYNIKTLNPHHLQCNDTVYMKYDKYNIITNKVDKSYYYICYITDIINDFMFECVVYDEQHKRINTLNTIEVLSYHLFKKDSTIPDYATYTKDGTCKFIWRQIINNGFDNDSDIENYPFFNGAFYVNKQINLFVKRQDPYNNTSLQSGQFPNDISSNILKNIDEDNYITESDMSC